MFLSGPLGGLLFNAFWTVSQFCGHLTVQLPWVLRAEGCAHKPASSL